MAPAKTNHVAVVRAPYDTLILEGRKTAELRLTRIRCAPFGRVTAGDAVWFKRVSRPIFARATVTGVHEFEGLTPARLGEIRARFGDALCAEDRFWRERRDARYATIIELDRVGAVGPDSEIHALDRPSRSAWRILDGDWHL